MKLLGDISKSAWQFIRDWNDDNDFIVAHTSGSTGTPKEVHLAKADMVLSARATNKFFCIDSASRLVCPLSVDYIAGKMMIVRAIEANCELWLEKPTSTPLIVDYGVIDLLPVVQAQLPSLLDKITANIDGDSALTSISTDAAHTSRKKVKNLLIGGAALSPDLEQRLVDAGVCAWVSYGMTETCSHVAVRKVGEKVYRAMPGIAFSVDDRSCLIVEGGASSLRRLTTNDVVDLIDSASFIWRGRADNVINSGGIKVFAEEIERKIAPAIPEATAFYVTHRDDEKWGQTPCIVIEGIHDSDTLAEILSRARELTHSAERPSDILYVEKIARTDSGKIRRLTADGLSFGSE